MVTTSAPQSSSTAVADASLRATVDGLCVPGVIRAVAQPIVRVSDLAIVGYEALARMPSRVRRPPDWWLERAGELGQRARLEIACWRAIAELGTPPDDALLFVNVSPDVLVEPDLLALRDLLPERLVIEVTEQAAVEDYLGLRDDLVPWLSRNARLAIDDTGAGHSSLRHVVELLPDFVKIDRSLVSGIAGDRNRRALVHSLVAFAREVGATVVAEGVETADELAVLRAAQVHLVQGYLLARPGPAWPQAVLAGRSGARSALGVAGSGNDGAGVLDAERLAGELARVTDAGAACEAVVEHLRPGGLLASVYLERSGQLRCVAQRGLWQVLDGMTATAGITGRTWSSGVPVVVDDVEGCADYLEAIPGVRAEACVPVVVDGEAIGALNVESLTSLPPGTPGLLERCARMLAERLSVLGWRGHGTPWRRAARASVVISELALELDAPSRALSAFREAAAMDSACLVREIGGSFEVVSSAGPLGPILSRLPERELSQLATLVENVSSCYTANDVTGRGFVGTESLRVSARAVVVLPLRAGGDRLGLVVCASAVPRALSCDDVEPLELLTNLLAATLSASESVARARRADPRASAAPPDGTCLGPSATGGVEVETGSEGHRARERARELSTHLE
ncbi:MAG TPA: EAL domain-containing protein [Acidimicrobiales bacterium]|nr:EAL domain-containing protein [Acidimicrobiales bacterium]